MRPVGRHIDERRMVAGSFVGRGLVFNDGRMVSGGSESVERHQRAASGAIRLRLEDKRIRYMGQRVSLLCAI